MIKGLSWFSLLTAIIALAWFRTEVELAFVRSIIDVKTVKISTVLPDPGFVDVGAIGKPNSELYFSLALDFSVSSDRAASDFPNLFQTAYGNNGIRIELHGSNLALIIGNGKAAEPPMVMVITSHLEKEKWHRLTLIAIERHSISVKLDDRTFEAAGNIVIGGEAVRIGVGFDDSRKFQGEIRNVQMSYGYGLDKYATVGHILYWLMLCFLVVIQVELTISLFRFQLIEFRNLAAEFWQTCANSQKITTQNISTQQTVWTVAAIGAVIATAIYATTSAYFGGRAYEITSSLLPGFAHTPGGGGFKREVLAFAIAQVMFATVIGVLWSWRLVFRKPLFLNLSRTTMLVVLGMCSTGAFMKWDLLTRMFVLLAGGFILIAFLASWGAFVRVTTVTAIAVRTLYLRLADLGRFDSGVLASSFYARRIFAIGAATVGIALLWSGKEAWFPVVLPNDYYEAIDRFEVGGTAGTSIMDRAAVQKCLEDTLATPTCKAREDLRNAFSASSSWQGATGRILYHHSYIFIPAQHWLAHGLDKAVPYLYGYGSTIFHAMLMKSFGGTLTSYFYTYPIALLIGLLIITGCVGYITRSRWLAVAAFLICLYELYSIDFSAALLAASFSPLRYAGIALQIASIFYFIRGSSKRVGALPFTAALSIFWNREFALIGMVGQALVLLSPQKHISGIARVGSLIALAMIAMVYIGFGRTSPDIANSISLGFFNVNMPILPPWDIAKSTAWIVLAQGIVTLGALSFTGPERAARLSILPVIGLSFVKAVFNPSPPHLSISLAFILPILLVFLPSPQKGVGNGPLEPVMQPVNFSWAKLAALGVLVMGCWVSGIDYLSKATLFKGELVKPFVTRQWSSLGETLPTAIPESPIAERVSAISEVSRPEDALLVLSPFDHLVSFYANPARYCGHFELLSNIATTNIADQVVECVVRTPNVLVIYDHALAEPCPDLTRLGIETECRKKFMAKGNIQHLLERLLPDLVEVERKGDLVFYRQREKGS